MYAEVQRSWQIFAADPTSNKGGGCPTFGLPIWYRHSQVHFSQGTIHKCLGYSRYRGIHHRLKCNR